MVNYGNIIYDCSRRRSSESTRVTEVYEKIQKINIKLHHSQQMVTYLIYGGWTLINKVLDCRWHGEIGWRAHLILRTDSPLCLINSNKTRCKCLKQSEVEPENQLKSKNETLYGRCTYVVLLAFNWLSILYDVAFDI